VDAGGEGRGVRRAAAAGLGMEPSAAAHGARDRRARRVTDGRSAKRSFTIRAADAGAEPAARVHQVAGAHGDRDIRVRRVGGAGIDEAIAQTSPRAAAIAADVEPGSAELLRAV